MNIITQLLRFYRNTSQYMRFYVPSSLVLTPCKYYPSCSEYAELALHKHGLVKGGLKSVRRICSCNPWSKGGVDLP
ncbi:membrane protein insertion efficiency factor YidD [Candidatus Parcubacteria bacterium]|nr:membrane protein insertion efficiency factor YidD [Candidatus Parcubacteria bacterium]